LVNEISLTLQYHTENHMFRSERDRQGIKPK